VTVTAFLLKKPANLSQPGSLVGLSSAEAGHVDALRPQRSPMTDHNLTAFQEHRSLLFGIAYRMLGSVADAEDVVQDTYVRWQQAADETIRSPRAWLTTVTTRLCLNHLQLAHVQRETYVGQWLPEPLVDEHAANPAEASALADSLSVAFLVLLENLNPAERAVFVLRECFGWDFSDIAQTVDKSEANCRQICVRARKRLEDRRPRHEVSRPEAANIVGSFVAALRNGDFQTMLAHLSENVVLVADGGDKPGALLRPLHGAETVTRAMLHAARKHGIHSANTRAATINGLPGFIRYEGSRAEAALAFSIVRGRIQEVYVFSNPQKLRHLDLPLP
jgi:RNA polymerase sigma-70 factor, ECF subfamily